jgi:hypothetical protein
MKARGVCKDVYGNLDWFVEAPELKEPSILCERLLSLYEQRAEARSQIEDMNPIFKERARLAAKRLASMLQ